MDREVNLKSVPFDMIKNWLFNIFFFFTNLFVFQNEEQDSIKHVFGVTQ